MKKILSLLLLTGVYLSSFGQADINRTVKNPATGANQNKVSVRDANLTAVYNLRVPVFNDWSLRNSKDSAGYVMFNSTLGQFGGYNGTTWIPFGSGGSSYTFNNGLNESGGVVKLGGDYTDDIQVGDLTKASLLINSGYASLIQEYDTNLYNQLTVNASRALVEAFGSNISLSANIMNVTDSRGKGLEYNADYSIGRTFPTDNLWIPNAGWVRSQIASGGGGAVSSVFGRTGAVTAQSGDYNAFYPLLASSYNNPTWINTLAYSKITGVPAFITTETDPVWSGVASTYRTKTQNDALYYPLGSNPSGYITSAGVPVYTAGYGMSLVGQQFRVDTTFILNKNYSSYILPEDYGAVGDGLTNDNLAINNAIAAGYNKGKAIYLQKGKNYKVDSLYNVKKVKIFGLGEILKNAPEGGTIKLNNNSDDYQVSFGQEYMTFFMKKYYDKKEGKILFSGESTTAGTGVKNGQQIFGLFNKMLINDGMYGIGIANAGHAGKTTQDWVDLYLDNDLLAKPSLYIVRWGINDTERGVDAYIKSLRDGLSKIRSQFALDSMSILLMSPNSISNSANGNDEKWVQEITPAIRQAARDFKCGFIDTYKIINDSRAGKGYYYDAIGVHPTGDINMTIASHIYDFVVPSFYKITNSNSRIYNEPDSDNPTPDTTANYFKKGITINRAVRSGSVGFPLDGFVKTTKTDSGLSLQENFSFTGSKITYRTSNQLNQWNEWKTAGGATIDDILFNGNSTAKSLMVGNFKSYSNGDDLGNGYKSLIGAFSGDFRGINIGVNDISNYSFISNTETSTNGIDFSTYNPSLTSYESQFKINSNGRIGFVKSPPVTSGNSDFILRNIATGLIEKLSYNSIAKKDSVINIDANQTKNGTLTLTSMPVFSLGQENNIPFFGTSGILTQNNNLKYQSSTVFSPKFKSVFSPSNDISLAFAATGSDVQISSTYNTTGSFKPMTFYTSDLPRIGIAVNGDVSVNNLSGTGDRPVFAAADGTLKIGTSSSYTLPIASSTVLGGVKVGSGLSIDGSGVLSATGGGGGGSGTVTSFGKIDNYGITSSVANSTTTPVHTVGVDTTNIVAKPYLNTLNSTLLHKSGAETASGQKTFSTGITTPFIDNSAGYITSAITQTSSIQINSSAGVSTPSSGGINIAASGDKLLVQSSVGGLIFNLPTNTTAKSITFRDLAGTVALLSDISGGGTTFADPTASIGLTAVNGVATTAMRSDAAPALSQAIAPTWSGVHTFANTVNYSALTATTTLGLDASKNVVSITNTGTGNAVRQTTPTLVTPVLGVATATSINKVNITAPTTSATLTLVTGSTLQTTGAFALNLTTTAASTPTFPTGAGTLSYLGGNNTWSGTNTYSAKVTTNNQVDLAGARTQVGFVGNAGSIAGQSGNQFPLVFPSSLFIASANAFRYSGIMTTASTSVAGAYNWNFYVNSTADNNNTGGITALTIAQDGKAEASVAPTTANGLVRLTDLSTLGFKQSISTKTASYSVVSTDYTILGDATTASFTITLPTASTVTGQVFNFKKMDASANTVTIAGTIDGVTNKIISTQYNGFAVQSTGTAYVILL